MQTYKLTIMYDGSQYKGWQRQKNTDRTIQGILESVLTQLIGQKTEIHGSGRTDRGVHAKGQTASVTLSGKVQEEEFSESLNEMLPEDIRIKEMIPVRSDFHARFHAKGKRYEYFIDTREKPDVFVRKYYHSYPCKLNIEAMEAGAKYLIGTHDFAGYTDKKVEKSTVRTIYDIIISQKEHSIRIEYYGTGFLYHMVRILTGTLLEIGAGEKHPHEAAVVLQEKKREYAGFLAPAKGLFLKEVYYSKEK